MYKKTDSRTWQFTGRLVGRYAARCDTIRIRSDGKVRPRPYTTTTTTTTSQYNNIVVVTQTILCYCYWTRQGFVRISTTKPTNSSFSIRVRTPKEPTRSVVCYFRPTRTRRWHLNRRKSFNIYDGPLNNNIFFFIFSNKIVYEKSIT